MVKKNFLPGKKAFSSNRFQVGVEPLFAKRRNLCGAWPKIQNLSANARIGSTFLAMFALNICAAHAKCPTSLEEAKATDFNGSATAKFVAADSERGAVFSTFGNVGMFVAATAAITARYNNSNR